MTQSSTGSPEIVTKSISTYLLILALVILIPFQLGGSFLIIMGQNAIRQEIKKSAINNVRYTVQLLERELRYLSNQLDELIVSTSFREYILRMDSMSTAEYYTLLKEQRDVIRPLYLGNELIADIIIYYRDSDSAMSASQGYIDVEAGRYSELAKINREQPGPLKTENNHRFLSSMYPASAVYADNQPVYLIQILLSSDYLTNLILSQNSEYQTFLFETGTDRYIGNIDAADFSSISSLLKEVRAPSPVINELETKSAYIIAAPSPGLNHTIVQVIPKNRLFHVPDLYLIAILAFTMLGVLLILTYSRISRALVKVPVMNILSGFRRVEEGNLGYTLESQPHMAYEIALLTHGFNHMSERLAQTVDKLYAKEIFAQKMELKQLQAQINPHFLYNTYFLLHRLVMQEDMETAKSLSAFLGEYFRFVTRDGQDKVPLQDEWGHASSYLEIQSLRFSATLKILIGELPSYLARFTVPRLILQPLLENAVEYGVKGASDGRIEMRCEDDDQYVMIWVKSFGRPVSEETLAKIADMLQNPRNQPESTALVNIQRRLQIEYGQDSGLFAKTEGDGALIMTVKMKKYALTDKDDKNEHLHTSDR